MEVHVIVSATRNENKAFYGVGTENQVATHRNGKGTVLQLPRVTSAFIASQPVFLQRKGKRSSATTLTRLEK